MPTDRRLAATAGVLYLITFATSIPALVLKTPLLRGEPATTQAAWACVLEIVLALACVGTAVVLYPVLRRTNPVLALGFVGSRLLEGALVLVGVVSVLALITLRRAGTPWSQVDDALVAVHDSAFLVGPGLLPAVNALLLGTALYRTRLVPRAIPIVGLIGAPLLLASALGTILGVNDQVSAMAGAAALPIAAWELALGLWLTVRGFRTEAVALADDGSDSAGRDVASALAGTA